MKHNDKELRAKYLKFANVLADIDCTTSDKAPITYEQVCELDNLLYALKHDYGFEYKKIKNHNGDYFQSSYNGLVFKEDNPDD